MNNVRGEGEIEFLKNLNNQLMGLSERLRHSVELSDPAENSVLNMYYYSVRPGMTRTAVRVIVLL